MPKTLEIKLNHKVQSDFDLIYQTLLDFRKFGKIHAYIKEVKIITDQSPEFIEYSILEEIYLLGFIKYHPAYDAKVFEIEKDKHIRYTSQIKKNIALIVDFHFHKSDTDLVTIEENICVSANPIIGKYFLGILKKAHLQFFENFRKLLQNSIEEPKMSNT